MLILAGVGPGSVKLMTLELYDLLKRFPKVAAFKRVAEGLGHIRKDIISVEKTSEMLEVINSSEDLLVLASGDVCFYGILELLKSKNIFIDEVICGISSIQYMAAKLKKSWHDAKLLSVHGRDIEADLIKGHKKVYFLTDSKNTPSVLSHQLYELGIRGKIFVGYNLSYDNEFVEEAQIGNDIVQRSDLAVVVIEIEDA